MGTAVHKHKRKSQKLYPLAEMADNRRQQFV